jgi:hypothetical protein
MDVHEAVNKSTEAERARAYREAVLSPNPTKEQWAAAGIDIDAKRYKAPEGQKSEIVFTDDVSKLPPNSSGRIVTKGVMEIIRTTDAGSEIAEEIKVPETKVEVAPVEVVPEPVSEEPVQVSPVFNPPLSSSGRIGGRK